MAIFEERARRLRRRLYTLAFLGIAFPGLVGGAYATYGDSSWLTSLLLAAAGVFGLLQFLASAAALAFRWEDKFGYAQASQSANRLLFERFRRLAADPPASRKAAERELELLIVEDRAQSVGDEKQGVTEEEKRMGMRAALRVLRKECASCRTIPTDMVAADCGVCGNFKIRKW